MSFWRYLLSFGYFPSQTQAPRQPLWESRPPRIRSLGACYACGQKAATSFSDSSDNIGSGTGKSNAITTSLMVTHRLHILPASLKTIFCRSTAIRIALSPPAISPMKILPVPHRLEEFRCIEDTDDRLCRPQDKRPYRPF